MKRNVLAFLFAVLCFTVLAVLAYQYLPAVAGSQDPNVYQRIGADVLRLRKGEITTLDSEYPPLASSVFFFVANNPFSLSFAQAWVLLLLLSILGTSIIVARGKKAWPSYALPLAILLTVFLLSRETVFARYDILVALLLTLAWNAHQREKDEWSGFALLLAAAIKFLPLLLIPVFLARTPLKRWKWWLAGAALGGIISILLPIVVLGDTGFFSNLWFFVQYHADRGFQAESTWSTAHILYKMLEGQRANLQFHHLALHNVDLPLALGFLAGLLAMVGSVAIAVLAWHRRTGEPLDRFLLAALLWILCVSTILSPQYFVWVIPLVLLWLIRAFMNKERPNSSLWWPLILTLFIGCVTHWVYPLHYDVFINNNSVPLLLLINARTIALVLLIWTLLPLPAFHTQLKYFSLKPVSARQLFIELSIAFCGFALMTFFFVRALCGLLSPAIYQYQGHEAHQTSIPFFVPSESNYIDVQVSLTLQPLYPTIFRIKPDDCIVRFEIDGKEVDPAVGNFCDFSDGKSIQLGNYLSPGTHFLHFLLSDSGGLGGINIAPSPEDPVLLTLGICLLVFACWLIAIAFRFFTLRRKISDISIPVIFCIGSILRVIYVFITPYNTRGHDTDAHFDYIRYVMMNFRMPLAVDGWEFHQPPLYYFITAIVGRVEQWFNPNLGLVTFISQLQVFSLFLSFITLAIILWIGTLLFPSTTGRSRLLLFISLIATIPSLIFVSSTISNDTLYQCLAFAIMGVLLYWWKGGSVRSWYLLILLVALACLTKVSASIFLPITFLCLLLHHKISWKKKLLHGGLALLLLAVITGWLPIERLYFEAQNSRTLTLGNEGMSDLLAVPTTPENMLTFNPVAILEVPFINSWYDTSRRQFFWEYFFRSAFFGEYTFSDALKPISIVTLFLGLLSLPLMAIGIALSLRKKFLSTLPLWFTTNLLFASILSYRLRFAYAPNQDFRFVFVLLIPLTFFAVQGAFSLPGRLGQCARGVLWALACSCGIFLLLLPLMQ